MGKTKHIGFSENCIDGFKKHSSENLEVAGNKKDYTH